MKILSLIKNLLLFVITTALLLGALVVFLPWQKLLEDRLKEMAAAQGYKGVELKIESLSPHEIILRDVRLPPPSTFALDHFAVRFSPEEILQGRLKNFMAEGLKLEAQQQEKTWKISGFESAAGSKAETKIPLTRAELPQIPFENIVIQKSTAQIKGKDFLVTLPFNAAWDVGKTSLKLEMNAPTITAKNLNVSVGSGEITLALNEEKKKWQGSWNVKNVSLSGIDFLIDNLKGGGAVVVDADGVSVNGVLENAAKDQMVRFAYRQKMSGSSEVKIIEARTPWKNGTITTENVTYVLGANKPTSLTLQVARVPIGDLMQDLTGKKATATGVVSGTLPITLMVDGKINVGKGQLQAEAPGTISLQPDAIPGEGEQLNLVREILKNLHYKLLSLSVESDKDNKLSINLALEGQNPDIENGRAVKLNVHLNGDLLDLLQNSVSTLTDPKKFLKEGQ